MTSSAHAWQTLAFDNSFTEQLPADPDTRNVVRQVFNAAWTPVQPTPAPQPTMLAWSQECAGLLGLEAAAMQSETAAEVLAGNRLLPGMQPHAACYAGHQFGNWAGQLGDGRAIVLGEVVHAGQRQTLQLKGAGPTPYSRRADGYAVLRSSVREFLCSEAMHHLGVPTTRALSLVGTGKPILRDMFYDGHVEQEPGAVVCRVAPSFIRFGNFELFASRQEHDNLRRLADYTLKTHFPEIQSEGRDAYLALFAEVLARTCRMVVHWQRVGFVHGVMNTDNMSIHGLTIDYGPYGWIDDFNLGWTPNTTDSGGRYAFGQQPRVALWNLLQLANALYPLIEEAEPLNDLLALYPDEYEQQYFAMMAAKLGWQDCRDDTDRQCIDELLACLSSEEIDMTAFFRHLIDLPLSGEAPDAQAVAAWLQPVRYAAAPMRPEHVQRWQNWLYGYAARCRHDALDAAQRRARMQASNPKYVLRNYLAQQAIDAVQAGDEAAVMRLLEVLRRPYDEQPEHEALAALRPEWARHKPGCSRLSCSS